MIATNVITPIVGAIFNGTWIFTILLLVFQLFRLNLLNIEKPTLITAVNTALLFGSTLFILKVIVGFFVSYYSGSEYEQYVVTNRYFGPFWFYLGAWPLTHGLIPQVLWLKRFRRSLLSLTIIVAIWVAIWMLNLWAQTQNPSGWTMRFVLSFVECLEQMAIYLVVIILLYYMLKRQKDKSATSSNQAP